MSILRRAAGILALTLAVLPGRARGDEIEEEERQEAIERHTNKGWEAFRGGNHDEVIARMERLAKLDPANPLPDYLLARIEARTGKYDEALARLEGAAKARPGDRAAESFRLRLLLDRSRFEEAEAAAREILASRADDLAARAALGIALEERGRREPALAEFREVVKATESEPGEDAPWVASAALRATRLSPDLDEDWIQPGMAHLQRRIEKAPDDQDARLAHADLWQEDRGARSQARAQKYYRELFDRNPEVAEGRVGYARYFLIFWQQDKAIGMLERALRTNPNLVPALSLLAAIHVGNGDYPKADSLLSRALATSPKDKEARAVKAARLWIGGDRPGFEALAKEILADDPTYASVFTIASELVGERQRRYDVAAELARRAVEVDPADSAAYVVLGENLMNIGLTDEAEKHFVTAYEKSKHHEDVRRENWRESLRILKTFTTDRTEHFVLRMHLSEAAVMRHYLPPLLEEAWTTLSAKYGHTPTAPVLVDSFHRADDFSVRSIGVLGLPALGVCFGRVITLLGPYAAPVGAFSWSRTAWHEFAHVVTLQLSEGQVPRWLTEGLSVYEEQARRPNWGRDMQRQLFDRFHNGRLLKMADINAAFRGSDILFAYYQGGLIAEHLEKTKGFGVVPEMLRRFAGDKTTEQVFRDVLSIELADYDRLFEEHVRGIVGDFRMVPLWDEESLGSFRERTAKDPKDGEAWVRLAWALMQRGKGIDAGAALVKARALRPDDPRIVLLEGRIAQANKRADLAESHYRRFLDRGGDDLEARLFLAEREIERGTDTTKAIEHLEAAKRCFPFHNGKDSPYLTLGKLYEGGGEGDKALAEYEGFARVAPENFEVRREKLLPAYVGQKRWENVARVCEEMVDISPFGANRGEPADLELHRRWADALLELGRKTEALRELAVQVEVVGMLPEEERVDAGAVKDLLRYGNLLLETGRAEEALEQAFAALRLAPDDAEAGMLRTRAREAGGDR